MDGVSPELFLKNAAAYRLLIASGYLIGFTGALRQSPYPTT
jgi:hypothetical protein